MALILPESLGHLSHFRRLECRNVTGALKGSLPASLFLAPLESMYPISSSLRLNIVKRTIAAHKGPLMIEL